MGVRVWVGGFGCEDVVGGDVVIGIVVAICGSPGKGTLHKRGNDLVDIGGGVLEECIFPRDQVTVEYDELWRFGIEDGVHDARRLDILPEVQH